MNLQDPVIQRRAFVILIGLLLGYLYFGATFFPFCYRVQKAEIERLMGENLESDMKLQLARSQAGRLDVVESVLADLERDWRRVERLLPANEAMPEFMREVTKLASKANVKIDLMQPGQVTVGNGFRSRGIEMRVHGDYHDLGRFLGHIANAQRLIQTEALTLSSLAATSARKNVEGGEKKGSVEATFKATLFMLEAGNAGY